MSNTSEMPTAQLDASIEVCEAILAAAMPVHDVDMGQTQRPDPGGRPPTSPKEQGGRPPNNPGKEPSGPKRYAEDRYSYGL